jgi:cold-inducible RNA-binding protein
MTNIYVGNLAFSVTESDLRNAFEQYGAVANVNIIMDRETGRSRGFAFVEMNDAGAAQAAIQALNLSSLNDRKITVNEARPKPARSGGGGGGGGRDGGGGGRRRY